MKFKIQMLLIAIFTIISSSYAQELSKTERKSLKKEIRTLLKAPVKYKLLKESLAEKETIVQEQTVELLKIGNENDKNKNSVSLYITKLEKIENELQTLVSTGGVDNTGLKFKLQIGKYKKFDISNFLEKKKLVTFEKDENGVFTYTIGNFSTEGDAELFKSAMRQMGIRDAFLAHYLDGVRIVKD